MNFNTKLLVVSSSTILFTEYGYIYSLSDFRALYLFCDSNNMSENQLTYELEIKRVDLYTLMHKNIPVAKLKLDDKCHITKIFEIFTADHLPYSIPKGDSEGIKYYLEDWFRNRSIPKLRPNLQEVLSHFREEHTDINRFFFIKKSIGLSLSDQYWLCPFDKRTKWEDVNFFDNNFSEDLGEIIIDEYKLGQKSLHEYNFISPDSTCDGFLPKMWKYFGEKRKLLKSGRRPLYQEQFNEVIASKLMDKLNIPHVNYEIIYREIGKERIPFSACECFITPQTEYITASQFIKYYIGKPNNVTFYQYYIDCCNKVGIKNAQLRIDQMIVVDFLIVNEDRHGNNFGLIRNAETLEFIDIAPIFDNGNSLWYDRDTSFIPYKIICKPFANRHYEQIKFVKNFDWLDLRKLDGFENDVYDILKQNPFFLDDRAKVISNNFKNRIMLLQKYIDKRLDPNFDTRTDSSFNLEMESFGDDFYDPFEKF